MTVVIARALPAVGERYDADLPRPSDAGRRRRAVLWWQEL